jgi:hypothetical protein
MRSESLGTTNSKANKMNAPAGTMTDFIRKQTYETEVLQVAPTSGEGSPHTPAEAAMSRANVAKREAKHE